MSLFVILFENKHQVAHFKDWYRSRLELFPLPVQFDNICLFQYQTSSNSIIHIDYYCLLLRQFILTYFPTLFQNTNFQSGWNNTSFEIPLWMISTSVNQNPIVIMVNVYFHDSCIRMLFIDEVFHSFGQLYQEDVRFLMIVQPNAF